MASQLQFGIFCSGLREIVKPAMLEDISVASSCVNVGFETEDIVDEERVKTIASVMVPKKSGDPHRFAFYKGMMVPPNFFAALVHVVDNFKDHFGHTTPPNLIVKIGEWETRETVDFVQGYPENYFRIAPVATKYKVQAGFDGRGFVAVDKIIFDLTTRKENADYGSRLLNLYFPPSTMKQITEKVRNDTGLRNAVHYSQQHKQNESGWVGVTTTWSKSHSPSFCVLQKEETSRNKVGLIKKTNYGTIRRVMDDDGLSGAWEGTGFFELTLARHGLSGQHTIHFHLISIQAYGNGGNLRLPVENEGILHYSAVLKTVTE